MAKQAIIPMRARIIQMKTIREIKVTVNQVPPKTIKRNPVMSLLPKDYANLANLPQINGVELIGNLSAKDLSILPADKDYYTTTDLTQEEKADKYLLGIDEENHILKMPVNNTSDAMAIVKTNGEINNEARIGTYQFVEKKNEE